MKANPTGSLSCQRLVIGVRQSKGIVEAETAERGREVDAVNLTQEVLESHEQDPALSGLSVGQMVHSLVENYLDNQIDGTCQDK